MTVGAGVADVRGAEPAAAEAAGLAGIAVGNLRLRLVGSTRVVAISAGEGSR
jgi:hypothetical protein